jgi:phage terminase large subunit-like protein
VDLAAKAGLVLDDWQAYVLKSSLRKDGDRWAAFEVGVNVPRQNGKGGILEARELAELFLVKSSLTIHSAHQYDTSMEAFRRLRFLIEETPSLSKQLKKTARSSGIVASHGEEGMEFTGNRRIRFRTRTKLGGRGFSCDCLLLDEAMFLHEAALTALVPTLSARPNPQVWYAGSAVDQLIHPEGVVWARVRERGHRGDDPELAYFEWSLEGEHPDAISPEAMDDPAAWAQANPALGIRIDPGYVKAEKGSLDHRGFAVERLGVGDWPRTDHKAQTVIDLEAWDALSDPFSKALDPVTFAFDASPDRRASISVAAKRSDDLWHVELVDDRPGTGWVADRIEQLVKTHRPQAVVCDGYGPAGSLVDVLAERNIDVKTLKASEHARACARLVDAIEQKVLRHVPDDALMGAVCSAQTRPLGDAWAWSRKNSSGNISPLVSATLALSVAMTMEKPRTVAFAWG